MPSFSRQLEESLHRAVAYANQRKHEYATLEHLLLALVEATQRDSQLNSRIRIDLVARQLRVDDAQHIALVAHVHVYLHTRYARVLERVQISSVQRGEQTQVTERAAVSSARLCEQHIVHLMRAMARDV